MIRTAQAGSDKRRTEMYAPVAKVHADFSMLQVSSAKAQPVKEIRNCGHTLRPASTGYSCASSRFDVVYRFIFRLPYYSPFV